MFDKHLRNHRHVHPQARDASSTSVIESSPVHGHLASPGVVDAELSDTARIARDAVSTTSRGRRSGIVRLPGEHPPLPKPSGEIVDSFRPAVDTAALVETRL